MKAQNWHCAFVNLAVHLNNWRVIPRLILLAYWHMIWHLIMWFEKIPAPTPEQVTVISLVLSSFPVVIGFYLKTGGIEKIEEVKIEEVK